MHAKSFEKSYASAECLAVFEFGTGRDAIALETRIKREMKDVHVSGMVRGFMTEAIKISAESRLFALIHDAIRRGTGTRCEEIAA